MTTKFDPHGMYTGTADPEPREFVKCGNTIDGREVYCRESDFDKLRSFRSDHLLYVLDKSGNFVRLYPDTDHGAATIQEDAR